MMRRLATAFLILAANACGAPAEETGPEWLLDAHGNSAARMERRANGELAIAWIEPGDAEPWHVQLRRPGIRFIAGESYRIEFVARAAAPRPLDWAFTQAHEPWGLVGPYQQVALKTAWDEFAATFDATATDDGQLTFNLAGASPSVYIANIRVTRLATGDVLLYDAVSTDPAIVEGPARHRAELRRQQENARRAIDARERARTQK